MKKKTATVRYSAKQIKAKIARGEDRTNWRKANAITGNKLEASIKAASSRPPLHIVNEKPNSQTS